MTEVDPMILLAHELDNQWFTLTAEHLELHDGKVTVPLDGFLMMFAGTLKEE
jgi:hypothetical protein